MAQAEAETSPEIRQQLLDERGGSKAADCLACVGNFKGCINYRRNCGARPCENWSWRKQVSNNAPGWPLTASRATRFAVQLYWDVAAFGPHTSNHRQVIG